MADENEVPKKDKRDPILMIGTIVLALAFVVVIGGYVYGELVPGEQGPMKFGDKVKVDYVGSYYGYYDGHVIEGFEYDKADTVIFDTSLWSVASSKGTGDEQYNFSYEFTKKAEESYSPFNVTIGSGGALKDFENALIGKKPGDIVHVSIPEAYGTVNALKMSEWGETKSDMPLTEMMTVAVFKATFGIDTPSQGPYAGLSHPYGWKSDAVVNSDGSVIVTHLVENGGSYKSNDRLSTDVSFNDDGTFNVKFTVDHVFTNDTATSVRLVEFKSGGQTYYITDVDEDKTDWYFKAKIKDSTTNETTGMTLYFVITVVGYQ
ncbi:MAG: FKBP-type peptidyl-prolyl cis-trans isomerase [Methanomassiliicoccaceae archaeon]|jgi:FKBP-type peptidyl-prolyl cis-trans isomerase 2|nr:FKBP-type peptidyl-prolyl cis-trans isomerase [Methanomassiliicoccaceae archaeon]